MVSFIALTVKRKLLDLVISDHTDMVFTCGWLVNLQTDRFNSEAD